MDISMALEDIRTKSIKTLKREDPPSKDELGKGLFRAFPPLTFIGGSFCIRLISLGKGARIGLRLSC